jgi:hypothetical protein
LPDANRHGLSAGIGLNLTDHLKVDAGYLFIKFLDRTVTNTIPATSFDGTYKSVREPLLARPRLLPVTQPTKEPRMKLTKYGIVALALAIAVLYGGCKNTAPSGPVAGWVARR